MEKNWVVECWGSFIGTELFFTKREAEAYLKSIRMKLMKEKVSSNYIFTRDSIVDINDNSNAVYLTNLSEL